MTKSVLCVMLPPIVASNFAIDSCRLAISVLLLWRHCGVGIWRGCDGGIQVGLHCTGLQLAQRPVQGLVFGLEVRDLARDLILTIEHLGRTAVRLRQLGQRRWC